MFKNKIPLICTLVFFVGFIASSFLAAKIFLEGPPFPDVRVEPTEIDFGTISDSEIQTGEFVLTNHGSAPISIKDVIVGCGCTRVDFRSGRLEPNEKTRIFVKMNPYGRKGEMTSSVAVTFVDPSFGNSKPLYLAVSMRAHILESGLAP